MSAAVGTDPIVPSAATGTGLGNYTITYVNGTLTVNPAALTITANNASKTYGTLGDLQPAPRSRDRPGDGQRRHDHRRDRDQHGAPATATVGTYPIVPSAATGTGLSNYTITYANGTLTVNPATLTITANNDSKTYGQTHDLRRHRVHRDRPGGPTATRSPA